MSLIDDVQRLAEIDPWYEHERAGTSFCIACGAYEDHTGRHHNPDCPWLSISKIVAALEAMHAILDDPEIQDCSDRCVEFVRRTLVDALTEPEA